jgi:hypothetical protein
VLLNPNGNEIVLDELGMDTFSRMQVIHQAEIAMKNTLLAESESPRNQGRSLVCAAREYQGQIHRLYVRLAGQRRSAI